MEELLAEDAFQVRDGAGDGRLRDPEMVGGFGQVAVLPDGDEVLKLSYRELVHHRYTGSTSPARRRTRPNPSIPERTRIHPKRS
jgi:hypothetical protein